VTDAPLFAAAEFIFLKTELTVKPCWYGDSTPCDLLRFVEPSYNLLPISRLAQWSGSEKYTLTFGAIHASSSGTTEWVELFGESVITKSALSKGKESIAL